MQVLIFSALSLKTSIHPHEKFFGFNPIKQSSFNATPKGTLLHGNTLYDVYIVKISGRGAFSGIK